MVKLYGLFDVDGKPKGFWADDVYPPQPDGSRNPVIPELAVQITEYDWKILLSNGLARYHDGVISYVLQPPSPPPPPPTDAQHANRRITEGVVAAIDIVKQVRADLLNVPDQFNANNFVTVKNQLRTLTEAIIAMLEAQRD